MKEAKSAVSATLAEATATVAHLQKRREEERSRLSRMLHHDVSGMLAAARMDLSRVSTRATDDEMQEQLRRIDHLLEQVIRDARREMQHLHPALLDHFGLPLAIRHLVEEGCRARDVRFTVSLDETLEGVDTEVQIAAFRLVEAVLGDCSGLAEFTARLAGRREGYVLELASTPAPGAAAPNAADMNGLRTWLRALGAAWLESAQGGRSVIELRIPRTSQKATGMAIEPVKSETPGG